MAPSSIIIPPSLEPTATPTGPWWLKVVYAFGIPAAIALYLVYVVSTTQAATMASIKSTVEQHATANLLSDVEVKAAMIRQEGYLRLLCVNTSKSIGDRNSCLSVR